MMIAMRADMDAPNLPCPPTHRRVTLAHPASLEQRERSCGLRATICADVSLKILGGSSGNKRNLELPRLTTSQK